MKLTKATIHKYKSYETDQSFEIDSSVTILVGKNEAGKTAALEALAKTRYFTSDKKFLFDPTHDYPRKEKKRYDKSEKVGDAITCSYVLTAEESAAIDEDLGQGVLRKKTFSLTSKYDNTRTVVGLSVDLKVFLSALGKQVGLTASELERLQTIKTREDIAGLKIAAETEQQQAVLVVQGKAKETGVAAVAVPESLLIKVLATVSKFLPKLDWADWLGAYIWETYISPNIPKFMYFDEYYELPARIDIGKISGGSISGDEEKTAKALFELADIDAAQILSTTNFESFISELEATSNEITRQLFAFWKNNTGLRITFHIESEGSQRFLNVRVWSDKHQLSLPLSNRSKGFNWFFSFIVWFSRIQEDKNSDYVLLLDEPGLNLHASAQGDLLTFIETLCRDYQIIYTTHSPFMVDPNHLERVRTVFEAEGGTEITDAVQQRDSDTLFPLQAALGYDIAQNLFISKNNLLVEGVSDLVWLTTISTILETAGRLCLRDDITLVPVGGLDKVASFISLIKSNKLNIACLLDTFTDQKGKRRLDDLIQGKIIKEKNVRFFDEFDDLPGDTADLEDLFEKSEYLRFFNKAFPEFADIEVKRIADADAPILKQIGVLIGKPRFNHYRPATTASGQNIILKELSEATLARFENMFRTVNSLF